MLESGSNRLGAIDFQESPEEYRPRLDTAGLDELYDAAEKVLAGEPLNPAIGDALMNGTAIGGAHPKVLISDESGVEYIAKLSVSTDVHPVDPSGGRGDRARSPLRHRRAERRVSSSRWAVMCCSSSASTVCPAVGGGTSCQA